MNFREACCDIVLGHTTNYPSTIYAWLDSDPEECKEICESWSGEGLVGTVSGRIYQNAANWMYNKKLPGVRLLFDEIIIFDDLISQDVNIREIKLDNDQRNVLAAYLYIAAVENIIDQISRGKSRNSEIDFSLEFLNKALILAPNEIDIIRARKEIEAIGNSWNKADLVEIGELSNIKKYEDNFDNYPIWKKFLIIYIFIGILSLFIIIIINIFE